MVVVKGATGGVISFLMVVAPVSGADVSEVMVVAAEVDVVLDVTGRRGTSGDLADRVGVSEGSPGVVSIGGR